MMPSQRPLPIVWTEEQLEKDRKTSRERFVNSILSRGTGEYVAIYNRAVGRMRSVFEKTNDLKDIKENINALTKDEKALFRYVSVPPLSDDDAKTVASYFSDTQGMDANASIALSVMSNYDPLRFEWLGSHRAPSGKEREEAIKWTCGLYAVQRVITKNRNRAGKAQEAAVRAAVEECGYVLDERAGFKLDLLDELPRGRFRKETEVASIDSRGTQTNAKADVPIRLKDGRLMLIECKVSNSEVNSIKRIERETCGKASGWRNSFGQGIILGLVFDGVASQVTLSKAQSDYGEYIFWGHRLDDLKDFLMRCDRS